jgi:CRISPR/Cas system-associated endoribonuclease Cas2
MAYFAVSYQLNRDKDYQTLWDEMDRLGGHKVMRSFYFLDVDADSAATLRDHLRQYVDTDDALAIVQIESRPAHYRAYKGTNDWINQRF